MKRTLLIGFYLLLVNIGYSQNTSIPDDNFEQALIDLGIDSNPILDNQVLTSAIENLSFLNLTGDPVFNTNQNEIGLEILDLRGIESFTSLEVLWVQGNKLVELDLEGMSTIKDVRAFFNDLERININGLTNLEIIGLNVNNLNGINVSTNTSLTVLDIAQNNLLAIDIRGLNSLTSGSFQNNAQLNCILVENAAIATSYNNNAAFLKNAATVFSNVCLNIYTQIPDRSFEQSLIDQGYDSEGGIPNGLVLTSDIASLSTLNVTNRNISDLTGLQAFSALENLFASDNNINSIDVSNNTNLVVLDLALNSLSSIDLTQNIFLEQLYIYRNNLTSLDVTKNTLLTYLNAEFMNLATIDVTQNPALEDLFLSSTNLSSIDISQNVQLRGLLLGSNNLTAIDVSIHPNLNTLYVNSNNLSDLDVSQNSLLSVFQAQDNLNLVCIQVADAAAAESQFNWQKDATANYSMNCDAVEKIVEVSVSSNQMQDAANNYVVTSANNPIQIAFNLKDENGDELDASVLSNYTINVSTVEATNQNPAQGGNVTIPGIDFELLTNEQIQVNTTNNTPDGNRTIAMNGDQLFEADEFFFVEVRTNDPNISLKNAVNGVVQIPVKIVDNEITNINLELLNNAAEPNQNARLRITSTLQNDTGAPIPFNVLLSGGNAVSGEDYEALTIQPAIPNGASSFEFDVTVINNDTDSESEENFFANISYAGNLNDGSQRVNIQDGNQEVVITDDGGLPQGVALLTSELKGDVQVDMNGNYFINEGGTIEIWIEATNANETNGQSFSFDYEVSTSGEPEDYTIISVYPIYEFTVDSNVNPDGKLSILVNADNFNDPEEFMDITLFGSPGVTVVWDGQSFDDSSGAYLLDLPRIKIINSISTETNIIAEINNIGGTEGNRDDVFTLTLTNLDGTPYTAPQDVIFPVSFAPAIENPAEPSDYSPQAVEFKVLANTSIATINVALPDETEENLEHEFYVLTIQPSTNFSEPISLPEPFQAKIIDDEGKFDVFVKINREQLVEADDTGGNCCPYYVVGEGTSIVYSFNAEKGAIDNMPYTIELDYDEGAANPGTNPDAMETDDFYTAVTDRLQRIFEFKVNDDFLSPPSIIPNPDNRLAIKIRDDDGEDDRESFTINIKPADINAKFNLVNSLIYSNEFTIIETIQASIETIDNIANETDPENNTGKFLIKLDEAVTTNLRVTYEIEPPEANGIDFLLINGYVDFMQGEIEKEIIIEAIDDDIPEGGKDIVLTLIPGPGYSVNENKKSGTVTIPENDQELIAFKITAEPIDDIIFEDPTKKNMGKFIVKLDQPNTSGIDLIVNYEFTNGSAINFAEENNDFTQDGNGTLIFKNQESSKEVTITALVDPEAGTENSETVTLKINEGNRYQDVSADQVTMQIISTEFNTSELSNTALEVIVASNTCANSVEGDILVKNSSQFDFRAILQPGNIIKDLLANSNITFDDQEAGTYLVSFEFITETIEIIPPSFEVTIQSLSGTNLLGQLVNLTSKTANLVVSGSKKYTIINGNSEHFFEFNNYSENSLEIPISKGINNLIIRGEAACQGVIKTSLYLNAFSIFPNPTDGLIKFLGFLLDEEAQINITDLSGKSMINYTGEVKNGVLEVDISHNPPGLYFGTIHTKSGQKLSFKILKR